MGWRTWRAAMTGALYGPGGFYARGEAPAGHFRTSVHASPLFAGALAELAGRAGLRTVVDVGAGRGELLCQLHALDPDLALHGVDVLPRPERLPAAITWTDRQPAVGPALVVANEWLDNVPLDVVVAAGGRLRLVLVDEHGAERFGPAPDPADRAWLDQWWPGAPRAEVGRSRDAAWAGTLERLATGVAVAVDYAHLLAGRPAGGTLAGYRNGRQVRPVPDGSCDLTAHLAADSCAAAGRAAGATDTLLLTQRDALHRLGVRGTPPPVGTAGTDPTGYLRGLERASQAAELTDPSGLGGFTWLVQTIGAIGWPIPLGE
ncbi:MAG TPA: SAM-dependent methyltransferase [Mycobacteriales bacterium]|nr:SAM-dependent methyltransferase [Mycobacteriales bacterium]